MTFDISSGEILLDIDTICTRLSITRRTFERLRRPDPTPKPSHMNFMQQPDDFAGMPPFPKPTVTLGRSPRWSVKVLNDWINGPRESVVAQFLSRR